MDSYPTRFITASALLESTSQRGMYFPGGKARKTEAQGDNADSWEISWLVPGKG